MAPKKKSNKRNKESGDQAANRNTSRGSRLEGNVLSDDQDDSDEENEEDPKSVLSLQRSQRQQRSVASHIRARQRAVAEREASRLARPEKRVTETLAHADRKKSAVASTPFGVVPSSTGTNGTKNEGWCGPFSVARQLIAEREDALRLEREAEEASTRLRQHPLHEQMLEMELDRKRKQHPSLLWKGKTEVFKNVKDGEEGPSKKKKKLASLYATRQQRMAQGGGAVPTLFEICINFLVDNFTHVQSVGNIDSAIRKRLVHELAGRNTLDDAALEALTEPAMEALEVVDASGISSAALTSCLEKLLGSLRYLVLDQAGRCFGPRVLQVLIDSAPPLEALAVGGAYLLKDETAARLISSLETTLQSVEFKACPLVGDSFSKSLVESKNLNLRELSLEDLTFSDSAWSALEAVATSTSSFWSHHLESLRLRRMLGLTDERMKSLLSRPQALRALDIGLNHELSDATLEAIRSAPCSLVDLRLTGLKCITSMGLQALFTFVPQMAPPPCLNALDLGRCNHEAVTDALIELVAVASSSSPLGLVELDIQGSTSVTDASLEVLVARKCGQTLQELNVSFCTKLTDQGLGYLVDHCGTQLKSLQIWGLAQVSEIFLDGHKRTKDPTFHIVGAWMKKNSLLAIR